VGVSYQDIDSRLRTVEELLLFIARNVRMRAIEQSGVVGPDGVPLPGKSFMANLLDLYTLSKQQNLPVVGQDESEPPQAVEAK
jgi:hypothetical protein